VGEKDDRADIFKLVPSQRPPHGNSLPICGSVKIGNHVWQFEIENTLRIHSQFEGSVDGASVLIWFRHCHWSVL
jgi:hypothetical protein